jgi:hypothetical protein
MGSACDFGAGCIQDLVIVGWGLPNFQAKDQVVMSVPLVFGQGS